MNANTDLLSPAPRVDLDRTETEKALADANMRKGELCALLGIDASLLSHWLAGRRDLPRDQAAVIAWHLGVPVDRIARDRFACPHCGRAVNTYGVAA